MELKDKIGQVITAHVPILDQVVFQELKLHGVEQGGIWVESQKLTDLLLAKFHVHASSKTLVFFLPYHPISFVMDSVDSPAPPS